MSSEADPRDSKGPNWSGNLNKDSDLIIIKMAIKTSKKRPYPKGIVSILTKDNFDLLMDTTNPGEEAQLGNLV